MHTHFFIPSFTVTSYQQLPAQLYPSHSQYKYLTDIKIVIIFLNSEGQGKLLWDSPNVYLGGEGKQAIQIN